MKKITLLFCCLAYFLFAKDEAYLSNYTPSFVIRNLYSGDSIKFFSPTTENELDWIIKEIPQGGSIYDPVAKRFGLSIVQLATKKDPKSCLTITRDNQVGLSSCEIDVVQGIYNTLFTIIPTLTTAVQIKAYNKGGVLCLNYDPSVKSKNPFSFRLCNFRREVPINVQELFVIIPSYRSAKVTNP